MSKEELDEEISIAAKLMGVTVKRAPINYVGPKDAKPTRTTPSISAEQKLKNKELSAQRKALRNAYYASLRKLKEQE